MNGLTWGYFTIVRNLSTDGKYSLGSFVVETNLQEFFPAVMIVKFEMLILMMKIFDYVPEKTIAIEIKLVESSLYLSESLL